MSRMVATTIETVDGWTRMVYHKTCVARYRLNSTMVPGIGKAVYDVVLNTGDYSTVTTKKRMNQFSKMFDLGFTVSQVKGQWEVNFHTKGLGYVSGKDFDGNTCEFTVIK